MSDDARRLSEGMDLSRCEENGPPPSAWQSPPTITTQLDPAAQVRWGLDYIRQRYGGWDVWRPRWRGRRRLVVQLGRLRVRVIWRWL